MSSIRTFVAAEVSADVRSRAAGLIKRLKVCGVKATWTQPNNLHLTLKFLGDVLDRRVPEVCQAVSDAAAGFGPMQLGFLGAGAFPRTERPRTVWIGVEPAPAELTALQQAIEDQLFNRGFPRERRRFFPHLTIGRVRAGGPEQEELGRLLAQHADFQGGSSGIDEVLVYGSFLDRGAPTYQVLGRSPIARP